LRKLEILLVSAVFDDVTKRHQPPTEKDFE